jgi:hypothetical protein
MRSSVIIRTINDENQIKSNPQTPGDNDEAISFFFQKKRKRKANI